MRSVEKKFGKQQPKTAGLGTENRKTQDHLNDASFRGPQDAVLLDVEPRTLDTQLETSRLHGPIPFFLVPCFVS